MPSKTTTTSEYIGQQRPSNFCPQRLRYADTGMLRGSEPVPSENPPREILWVAGPIIAEGLWLDYHTFAGLVAKRHPARDQAPVTRGGDLRRVVWLSGGGK